MSVEVTTSHGVLRRVTRDGEDMLAAQVSLWLLSSPVGRALGRLHQLHGRVRVLDHAAMGCPGGYHETH